MAEPVPFVMWGPGFAANGAEAYTEEEARATGFAVAPGHLLMSLFLGVEAPRLWNAGAGAGARASRGGPG